MGAFLDKPKTEKYNHSGKGKNAEHHFNFGMASMQGWRIDMEDTHNAVVSIKDCPPLDNWSFFAVFDGHAGSKVAQYSAENLLSTILSTPEFQKIEKEKCPKMTEKTRKLIREGLTKGFLKLDEEMAKLHGKERSGSTAICSILTPEYIFFANLGDSRAVLSRRSTFGNTEFKCSDEPGCPFTGTVDHKPFMEKEKRRIVNAGGSVMIQRVNGSLAVSRALGDFEYKSVPNLPATEQLVSPEPEIYEIERNKVDDEFLVLACDGIYDVLDNAQLCSLVRSRLMCESDLERAANQILDVCLSKGSRDNMTLILIVLEAAPKHDTEKMGEEQRWLQSIRGTLQQFFDELDKREAQQLADCAEKAENCNSVDAEHVSNWLRDREFNDVPSLYSKDEGIHLARTLIDQMLKEREQALSASTTGNAVEVSPAHLPSDEDEKL